LNNSRFTTNAPASTNPGAYTPGASFPPQEGKGLDVGIKFQLLDKKLSGNLTYFDIDYTQIPITSATIQDNQGNFVGFPGGSQNSKGEEIELFYTPNANLKFTGSVSHMDAKYTQVTRGQEYLLGKNVGASSQWQGSLFGLYTVNEGGLKGFSFGAGGYYMGDGAQGDLGRFPPNGYTVFDLVLGYSHKVSGLDVSYQLNVTNLTDKDHYQDFTGPYSPRMIGFSTRVKF